MPKVKGDLLKIITSLALVAMGPKFHGAESKLVGNQVGELSGHACSCCRIVPLSLPHHSRATLPPYLGKVGTYLHAVLRVAKTEWGSRVARAGDFFNLSHHAECPAPTCSGTQQTVVTVGVSATPGRPVVVIAT